MSGLRERLARIPSAAWWCAAVAFVNVAVWSRRRSALPGAGRDLARGVRAASCGDRRGAERARGRSLLRRGGASARGASVQLDGRPPGRRHDLVRVQDRAVDQVEDEPLKPGNAGGIQSNSNQPPLYYLLGAGVYLAFTLGRAARSCGAVAPALGGACRPHDALRLPLSARGLRRALDLDGRRPGRGVPADVRLHLRRGDARRSALHRIGGALLRARAGLPARPHAGARAGHRRGPGGGRTRQAELPRARSPALWPAWRCSPGAHATGAALCRRSALPAGCSPWRRWPTWRSTGPLGPLGVGRRARHRRHKRHRRLPTAWRPSASPSASATRGSSTSRGCPFMNDQFAYFPPYTTWFKGAIGLFGWLDTPFPNWAYTVALVHRGAARAARAGGAGPAPPRPASSAGRSS